MKGRSYCPGVGMQALAKPLGLVGSLLRTSGCTLSLLERQLLSSSDPLGAWHEYVLILGPGEKLSSLMSAMSILT